MQGRRPKVREAGGEDSGALQRGEIPQGVALPLGVSPAEAYRMRWKRRRLLWRSFRSRHHLTALSDRTGAIRAGDVLLVMTQRNEALRLPFFLKYYRALGVGHFLVVDNGSTDGSVEMLAGERDVSLWQTRESYGAARFGLDWMTWLQMRYAHGHWCLMVDADELMIWPERLGADLRQLTTALDAGGVEGMGALLLDLFPRGALGAGTYTPGQDPREVLQWFDPGPYRARRQRPMNNLWVQGGTRERVFFSEMPVRAPTLNKLPLIRWNRRYAYVNSCHSALPPRLNALYSGPGGPGPSGVLLHTKFLPDATARAVEEKRRGEHFTQPAQFSGYYDSLSAGPELWHPGARRLAGGLEGAAQLERLGLMSVDPAADPEP